MALLLCSLAVMSMLGGQIHAVAVRHVRCTAHGELKDARPGPEAASTDDAALSDSPTVEEDHDHCAVASAARQAFSLRWVHAASAMVIPPPVQQPVIALVLPPAPARSRIDLAPKTSPPRG
jgi:hypothetical protein